MALSGCGIWSRISTNRAPRTSRRLAVALALSVAACRCEPRPVESRLGELNFVFEQGGVIVTAANGDFDFGKVAMGVKKTIKVTLQNRGQGSLDLVSAEKLDGDSLKVGEEGDPAVFTLGFAPMRISSFEDPRVKAKAVVGPGTTRHLETEKWTIDNVMASEPDMPLWAGFSNNEIPVELGKLLTNQDYGGDAKKCMDNVASLIDKAVEDAGLL